MRSGKDNYLNTQDKRRTKKMGLDNFFMVGILIAVILLVVYTIACFIMFEIIQLSNLTWRIIGVIWFLATIILGIIVNQ